MNVICWGILLVARTKAGREKPRCWTLRRDADNNHACLFHTRRRDLKFGAPAASRRGRAAPAAAPGSPSAAAPPRRPPSIRPCIRRPGRRSECTAPLPSRWENTILRASRPSSPTTSSRKARCAVSQTWTDRATEVRSSELVTCSAGEHEPDHPVDGGLEQRETRF